MPPIPKKTLVVIGGVVGVVLLLLILLFSCIIPGLRSCSTSTQTLSANLTMWGVGDTPDAYKDILANFSASYPDVKVVYRSFADEATYQRTLLEALAANQGPDIFEVRNNEVAEQYNKIAPLPSTILPFVSVQNLFPRVVEQNFAPQGTVYALPLSIDTLALIYNRRLVDQAAVTVPATWEEFKDVIPKLSSVKNNKIDQATIALGGSEKNVHHAADILSLLMLQSGTQMVSSDFRSATFGSTEGTNALSFYTQFANAASPYYTWNASMPSSLDSFGAEHTAMVIDYASALKAIRAKNAFLDIGIAPVPQPKAGADRPIAYAHYWGYTVSRQSKNQEAAWRFIVAMTTDPTNAESYVKRTGEPPALSSLLKSSSYLNDPELSVFARQALIARAWPEVNAERITQIFSDMIDAVNANTISPEQALGSAEDAVTQLMAHAAF